MESKESKTEFLQEKIHHGRVVIEGVEGYQPFATSEGNIHSTQTAVPVSDDHNTLKIGEKGPALMEDFVFREKITHFDHERIPERVVHARGFGVHGYFENYRSLSEITSADLFQRAGEQTPTFVRFSTVVGNKGSMDLARDVRGFATKFYTKEGNWDLVGNNIPVFFIQDAIKFPDVVHAAKPEPDKHIPQAQTAHDNFWDFISLMPESAHMIMWTMSDRAIPRSYRFMEGFGVHTFRFVNKEGKSTFVKFHWKPKLGLQSVLWDEALKINGADPDFHRRDLFEAIKTGNYPEWELGLQIFDEKFAETFPFDHLDSTKFIPEEDVPITIVGRLVLNKNVDNFFLETEQVAFCTSNIVPGIDFTNDPLLQGRNFSYLDTQLKRLGGPNFNQIPINTPRCPVFNFQQDGHMAMRNPTTRANYEPNSWGEYGGPRESPEKGFHSFPVQETGQKIRHRSATFLDHFSQARQFYISQTLNEQLHIANALVFELSKCERLAIRERMVSHLHNIDTELANRVTTGLGMIHKVAPSEPKVKTRTDLKPSPSLSIILRAPQNVEGRKLGILMTDGADDVIYEMMTTQLGLEKCLYDVISIKIGGVLTKNGKTVIANKQIQGGPSVIYDAIAILATEQGVNALIRLPPARQFVADAFAHLKFIGYSGEAVLPLFEKAGILGDLDEGCMEVTGMSQMMKFMEACKTQRLWKREALFLPES